MDLSIYETGAKVEFLLLNRIEGEIWECIVRPGNKLHIGAKVIFGDGILKAEVLDTMPGGTRKVESTDSQKELVYQEENGEKAPIIQKTVQPKIEGAIITAKGASNATVKTNIVQAVEAATGLATHKIQVFEMK